MIRAGRLTYILINFTTFFSAAAFAANKGSLHVHSPTMAGETLLPAGEYAVQWEGSGPDVEVKIKLDNRVKATVQAKVMPLYHSFGDDAAVLGNDDEGGRKLLELRLSGKKFFLQIEPQAASTTLPQSSLICPDCQPELPW